MTPTGNELNVPGKAVLLVGFLLASTVGGSIPAIAAENISLQPTIDFNQIGDPHTLIATVVDAIGQPVAGRQVDFEILSGPHAGLMGSSMTDPLGHAIFTYTGTASGSDIIVASLVDADGIHQTSNSARKEWFQPRCGNGVLDPGEECEPRMFCAGDCNPVTGTCFDIACASDCTCPCGNGILDPGEQCDDMNRTRGDGCSSGCLIERCPLGAGFWKNHPDAWEVDSLVLGKETYSKADLLAILETPAGSGSDADASLLLADQMIAAKLNIAAGSAIAPEIASIVGFPDPLFEFPGELPYRVDPRSSLGEELVSAARTLEKYNKGKFTPDCETLPKGAGLASGRSFASGLLQDRACR